MINPDKDALIRELVEALRAVRFEIPLVTRGEIPASALLPYIDDALWKAKAAGYGDAN